MVEMAQFEKVSFEQFKKDVLENILDGQDASDEILKQIYDSIELPKQATEGSAGNDFVSFCWFKLAPKQTVVVPTGIKVFMEPGWFLGVYPRSSLGFKYRLQLDNTVGIIDSDYYNNPKNEGHVILRITNDSHEKDKILTIEPGDKFAQGIFQPYGVVYGNKAEGTRVGGFGSTNENK